MLVDPVLLHQEALGQPKGGRGEGRGTNIHWREEPQPGVAAMISRAYRVVRMDFTWALIETARGVYNFSEYDTLLGTMKAHGLRPYWILDYGNPLYPPTTRGSTCDTAVCVAAFARFAAAAVSHFKGNDIIFECINEPNGMGRFNATNYATLCLGAGVHFTAAGELFVGPATSGVDWTWLNATFSAGALGAFGAVSVHPYRQIDPDTVLDDWARLRALVDQHDTRRLPMISGEWGYTNADRSCRYAELAAGIPEVSRRGFD